MSQARTSSRTRRRGRSKSPDRTPRLDIQGLRALAVVAVILNHLTDWPSGAFVGVDVFFVISGFLITGILVREYENTGRISPVGFYQRRVKRIVPAATLVLVVTVCASAALLNAERAKTIGYDAASAFLFYSNWRFAQQGTDYFQRGLPPSPLQHYWSLSVEEQFYFVWPWLMLVVLIVGTRLFRWERRHSRIVAGVLMTAIVIGSFAWSVHQTTTNPDYAYFSGFTRVWELGAGALLAICEPKLRITNVWARTILAWVGLAGIVVSMFVVPADDGFPAPWGALPVLATAIVILAGCGGAQPHLWPLTNPLCNYVGNISYSLYLWHFPVVVLLAALVETHTIGFYAIAAVLIGGLSIASFHLVEDPLRQATWIERGRRGMRLANGWRYAGLAGLVIVTATLVAMVLDPGRIAPPPTSPFAAQAAAASAPGETREQQPTCIGAQVLVPDSDCPLNSGDAVYPTPESMIEDKGVAYDCWTDDGMELQTCSYGSTAPDATKVALLGDSHAAQVLNMLMPSLTGKNWSLDTYLGEGCQWRDGGVCGTGDQVIQDRLETGDPYDIVITTSARQYAGDDPSIAAIRYEKAWRPVANRGTKVIVLADVPQFPESALECVNRVSFSVSENCYTPLDEATEVPDALIDAAKQVEGASLIDLQDYFCRGGKCPAVIGNVMVYKDTVGHITATYATSLAPYFLAAVDAAMKDVTPPA